MNPKASSLGPRDMEFLARIVEAIPGLAWFADPEGLLLFANGPWLRFRGRSQDQELGLGWFEDMHPEDLGHLKKTVGAALQQREEFSCEVRIRSARNDFRLVQFNAKPLFLPDDRFAGFLGTSHDLTDQRRIDVALDTIDQGWVLYDHNQKLVVANREHERLLGLPQGMLKPGLDLFDVLRALAKRGFYGSGDPEAIAKERLAQLVGGGVESRLFIGRVEERYVEVHIHKQTDGGLAMVLADVTEETVARQRDELVRKAVDQLPQALIVYDTDAKLLYSNKAYQELFPYLPPSDEIVGMPFLEVIGYTMAQDGLIADPLFQEDREAYIQKRLKRFHRPPEGPFEHRHGDRLVLRRETFVPNVGYIHLVEDITELRRIEDVIRESETETRLVMNNVPARIAYYDADLRFRHGNEDYAGGFGFRLEDLLGKHLTEIFAEDRLRLAMPRIERALAGEKVVFEAERATVDRGKRWYSITYLPKVLDGGAVDGFYVLYADIHDYKEAAEALHKSEQRFRDVVEASSDWFWEMDRDLRFSYVSERARDVGGISLESTIGRHQGETAIDPKNTKAWHDHRATLEAHLPYRDFRYSYIGGEDGKLHHLSVSGVPVFDQDGSFAGYRGSATDITTQVVAKQEAGRARDLFIHALDGIPLNFLLFDPEDRLIYANRRVREFTETLGVPFEPDDTVERILRRIAYSGTAEGSKGREELWLAEMLERHRIAQSGFRIKFTTPDTSVHWHEGYGHRTAGGYTLASYLDVTELVRQEDRLRQAQKMEAVGQLTGGVAHDFNNILAIILGNLDLAMTSPGADSQQAALLSKAVGAAERGAAITQRLLAFSRRQPLAPKVTDVNLLIDGMSDLLASALREGHDLKVCYCADLWLCFADPSQIENVVLNLAINSRDAMPRGGTLTIEMANSHLDDGRLEGHFEVEPGDYVRLTVTDTGCGMTPEVKDHAFEPFFTTKDVGQGSGLGLSMVFGFVKQSHGHISLQSTPGEGTTIEIYLPRVPLDRDEVARSREAPEAVADLAGRGRRVLVVEDEPEVLALAVGLLTELGYRPFEASSGMEALALLADGAEFDLLLTDVVLAGGINGRDLADAVTTKRPAVRVVYMTGYAQEATMEFAKLDEQAVVLQKPFRKNELAVKLYRVLARENSPRCRELG